FTIGNSMVIINSTITANRGQGDRGGGIRTLTNTTLLIHNSIIAGNFADSLPSDVKNDIRGTVRPESSFNVIGVNFGLVGISDGLLGNQVGTRPDPLDPGLKDLANN